MGFGLCIIAAQLVNTLPGFMACKENTKKVASYMRSMKEQVCFYLAVSAAGLNGNGYCELNQRYV